MDAMFMAKQVRNVSMGMETKAADILYDSAQECDLSLTAFVEKTAYYIARHNKQAKKTLFEMIKESKEPEN